MTTNRQNDLERIVNALRTAGESYDSRPRKSVSVELTEGNHLVTDAERDVNELLFKTLVRRDEGWLSEQSADDYCRLGRSRIWLVDPLDGTEQYIHGIPEWCISIALIEGGEPVAGGVYNPVTKELFYGSRETGVLSLNGAVGHWTRHDVQARKPLVLASRSEVSRGEWERFRHAPFDLQPMGSVAYKLARVAAGKADATWTLVPKHEWDVAAGVALLQAAHGYALTLAGDLPSFNKRSVALSGLVGFSVDGAVRMRFLLDSISENPKFRDCWPWAAALVRFSR